MSKEVTKQKIFIELEEKAKRKALTKYIEKLQDIDRLKKEGRYEEPLPPVKATQNSEEIIAQIDEDRRQRFRDDKESIRQMAKLREGKPPKIWPKEDTGVEYWGIMYPVDPEVLAVLYEGISHNDEGRRHYLKLRNKLDPADRYYFSQSYNMDYGWRVEARKLPTNKQFAKVELINRTFYTRNGIKGETLRNKLPMQHEKPSHRRMTAEIRKEMALTEIQRKMKAVELTWFKKNFKKIYIDSGLLPSEIPKKAFVLYNELQKWEDEAKAEREKQLKKMEEDMLKPVERKWKPSVVTKWDLERGIMYPVEEEVKEVLYNGISHNDEGRRRYLHIRNLEEPCDRFYEPQAYGMDYGWNIAERGFPPNKQFATAEVIKSEFYRRYGVKGETLRNRLPIKIGVIVPDQL